jgi:hypothetical protein
MKFEMVNLLFNLLILLFWYRSFNQDPEEGFWNPHMLPLRRYADMAMDLLRPAFAGAPVWVTGLLLVAALVVFRALVSPGAPDPWQFHAGFIFAQPKVDTIPSAIVLSLLSTGVFLLEVWTLAFFYLPASRKAHSSDRTRNALHALSRPFSRLPAAVRLSVLVVSAALLAIAFDRFTSFSGPLLPDGESVVGQPPGTSLGFALRAVLVGMSLGVDVLQLLQQFIVILIVGTWAGSMFGMPAVNFFCREWMELALGPLRRRPIRIAFVDLTPVVFLVLLGLAQFSLQVLLIAGLQTVKAL